MSQKDKERFSKKLDDAENTARIRLFAKASKKYSGLVKSARSIEPEMVDGLVFLAALYAVNQDARDKKDPLQTGSFERLLKIQESTREQTLSMALPGGFFGNCETSRVFKEIRAIVLMDTGVTAGNTDSLKEAMDIFLEIGGNQLFFSRYVRPLQRRVKGNRAALECEARRNIIKGNALSDVYPNAAIPHYMVATRALRAARKYDEETRLRQRLIGLRMVRRCWFCGRLVQGANHFRRLPSQVTQYFENLLKENKEDLRVYDGEAIYACVPCAMALSKESEKHALEYYKKASHEIQVLRSHVQKLTETVRAMLSTPGGK